MSTETIAALSTPYGVGGVAVIRCSGDRALDILKTLSHRETIQPRQLYHGLLKDPENGDLIDDACIVYFKGPHSYTGEDCVEFHCHSSLPVIKKILTTCYTLGARPAKEGEFTKRAYMNGKLDLSKAEAISDLIHAKTELESTVALNQLQGKLYHTIQTIKHNCQQLLEHIEACIDFPEEVDPPEKSTLKETLDQSITLLEPTIKHQDYGRFIHSGVKCLIIGYPNVGKSSLLNQLLGEDRAIVSDIKGTTRDFIESTIEIGGLLFELIDTAGYRDTTDEIEAIGIEKIKQLLPNCDAILWVIDQTRELNEHERELQKLLPKTIPTYLILNKSDQNMPHVTIDTISHTKALSVSAKNGDNISQINDSLYNDFSKKANDMSNDLLCNMRQLSCIEQLYNRLTEMSDSMKTIQTLDMLVIDLKQAVLLCGDISGETLTEDVLDGVFSRFCVGK